MTDQPSLFQPEPVPVTYLGTPEAQQWYEQVWQQFGKPENCPVRWALKALEGLEATRPTSESAEQITERFMASMPKGEL